MKALVTFGLLLLAASSATPAVAGPGNRECQECHRQPGEAWPVQVDGSKEGKPIDMKRYAKSVHADLACVECHSDAKADTHTGGLGKVSCGGCHETTARRFSRGAHARAKDPVACWECHGTHDTLKAKDPDSQVFRTRLPETCRRCHDSRSVKGRPAFERGSYEQSIHYRGMTDDGLTVSATCSDCHGGHDMSAVTAKASPVFRDNVPRTCGQCHEGTFEQYTEGAHGQALARGSSDTPVCTDCHGEHGIRDTSDPASSVFATTVSKSTCPQCHSAEHVNRRYGLLTTQVERYRETFHGLADQLGDPTVANCASCHGAHLILDSADPRSSVSPANLQKTCGKCHPGAGKAFARGSVHAKEKAVGGAALGFVRKLYVALITLTIGGMLAYNGLDYFATLRERLRAAKQNRRFIRFTLSERLQHLVLVLTFVVLAVTGFALRHPSAAWVEALRSSGMSFLVRSHAHRIAAIVFVAASAYHLYFLFATERGRSQRKALLPHRKDLAQLAHQLRYYLGLEKKPACFARYSYVEKVEYLALIWGSVVMVVTGFILWFEVGALSVLPMWGWDLAELVHLYEAWLATLSILVWHLYHVALKPSGHGVSLAMLTGEATEDEMKQEHPAELETLLESELLEPARAKEPSHDTPASSGHMVHAEQ